jgi:Family of unknown function (DUF5677)
MIPIDLSAFHDLVNETNKAGTNSEAIKAFAEEADFTGLGVDFLVEAGSYVCIAACTYPSGKIGWTRDEAIIGGNFVRLFKLISAILDQTCQHRRETTFIFGRLAFETIVNTKYLLKYGSKKLFDSYVEYSLQHEHKLLASIEENIAARDGIELPIEQRMKRSVNRMFEKSEISATAKRAKIKNWGDKNLFERSKDVDLDTAYLGVFGGGSHAVHGNWPDLLEYHVIKKPDGFHPQLDWRNPRPQVLTTIALLCIELVREYFCKIVGTDQVAEVERPLYDFYQRLTFAVKIHEEFLKNK